MGIANLQECFFDILEQDEEGIQDLLELNEKFLSTTLGIEVKDLAMLEKIELRVDTSQHNLQATGEVLCSLEYLKLSDSIIRCFRDIGTSFRNVRVLWLNRCELKEVQGIQAFEHLEELYMAYNDVDELFDIGFLEQLEVLDMEGNNLKSLDQLYYLRRCTHLKAVNLKCNPVQKEISYYSKLQENVPNLLELDEEALSPEFFDRKKEEAKKASLKKTILEAREDKNLFEISPLANKLIEVVPKELLMMVAQKTMEMESLDQFIQACKSEALASLEPS